LFQNIALFLSDLFDILWVINKDLNTELKSEFIKIEIKTSNFSVFNFSWHLLMSLNSLDGVTSDQLTFSWTLTMSLKNVNGFNWIFSSENCLLFNSSNWLDDQISEKFRISVDKFWWHWSFGAIKESFISETFDSYGEFILNVSACLSSGHFESSNDIGWMNVHFNKFVGSFQ